MSARTESFGIKPKALDAWRRLQELLHGAVVPCTGDPDVWWSDDPEVRAYAARACLGCLALHRCGEFAAANRETAGVWAGVDRTTGHGVPTGSKINMSTPLSRVFTHGALHVT